jgi:hypothetical protein
MFYIDLQPVSLPGFNADANKYDRNHVMIIIDDVTRYCLTLCLATKADASLVL